METTIKSMAILPAGTELRGGTYRIKRFISSGGFGCTYEAEHEMLEQRVAIKEFFVKDFCNRDESTAHVTVGTLSKKGLVSKLLRKFVEEARALSKLKHAGIVKVSDVFEENGTAYYVMDYVDGQSLSDMVKREGPLPEHRALGYIRQVCDALAYVHDHNRLHLDIKPANIMVGSDDKAVLIDFGASKQYDEADGENTSTLMGKTPGYAPPEQMSNQVVKFLPATDIYSVGATLYKLLTGITPPDANLRISGEDVEPLPKKISVSTCEAVNKALALNKKSRPQTVAEFIGLLNGGKEDATVVNVEIDKPKPKPAEPTHPEKAAPPVKPAPPVEPSIKEEHEKPAEEKKKSAKMWVYLGLAVAASLAGYFYQKLKDHGESDKVSVELPIEEEAPKMVQDMAITNTLGKSFTYTGHVNAQGEPEGKGTGVYKEGTYVGMYKNGVRAGECESYKTHDGKNVFTGTYANDHYSKGRLTWTDDNTYFEGTFREDNPYTGTMYSADGKPSDKLKNGHFE